MPEEASCRLKVLISAYACAPCHGSEPEVGWSFSRAMAAHHDVWVLTRSSNRARIEKELKENPAPGLKFLYYDPPDWFGWGRHGGIRMQLHSYFWQLMVIPALSRWVREFRFDVAHHVTFAKYWAPSCLAWTAVPFVWGPVGGAERTPASLLPSLDLRGRLLEFLKLMVSRLGELDPLVRRTAARASVVFASTEETAVRLRKIGCEDVRVKTQIGINGIDDFCRDERRSGFRFLTVGRLIHWKGVSLGLAAFEKCGLADAEYWIVGDGPYRAALEKQAAQGATRDRVRFFGSLSVQAVVDKMRAADVLVHSSFHDSAGLVCLEAMAAGMPVVCLDAGGPSGIVDEFCGVRVPPGPEALVVERLAEAMRRLATNTEIYQRMSAACRRRVRDSFLWEKKAEDMAGCYSGLCGVCS